MVAPDYEPMLNPKDNSHKEASRIMEKRRQEIQMNLLDESSELRLDGNAFFKDRLYDKAAEKYNDAIHLLQKVPQDMGASNLVKTLNNRGRVYVKLNMMARAEADASEVLSKENIESEPASAALLVRYHARVGLGAIEQAVHDLRRSADLGNVDAQKLVFLMNNNNSSIGSGAATHKNQQQGSNISDPRQGYKKKLLSTSNTGGRQSNGLSGDKLTARRGAGAGEELAFGGSGSDSVLWGQWPVPDVDIDAHRTGVLSAAQPAEEERLQGEVVQAEEALENVGGRAGEASGEAEEGDKSEGKEEEEKERGRQTDTSPPQPPPSPSPSPCPHPLLEHPAVKRCISFIAAVTGAAADGMMGVKREDKDSAVGVLDAVTYCASATAAVAAAAGVVTEAEAATGTISNDIKDDKGDPSPGGGSGDRTEDKDKDQEHGGGKEDKAVLSRGSGDRCDGKYGAEEEGACGSSAKAKPKASLMVDDAPAPAKQAQDVRCLVAQAKAKPEEGDVWAVLDRQWWLRWQRFTGCEENPPGYHPDGGEGDNGSVHTSGKVDVNGNDDVNGNTDVNGNVDANRNVDTKSNADVNSNVDVYDVNGHVPELANSPPMGAGEIGTEKKHSVSSCDGSAEREDGCVPDSDARSETNESTAVGVAPSYGDDGRNDPAGATTNARDRSGASTPVASSEVEGEVEERVGKIKGDEAADGREGKADVDGNTVASSPNGVHQEEGNAMHDGRIGGVHAAREGEKAPAPPHPGPIDNSGLVMAADARGKIRGTGRRLRLRLVRGYHFVLVPQEAWKALHAWYGGGPALPRALVPVQDGDSGVIVCEPQLYPELSRLDPVLRSTVVVSRSSPSRGTNPVPKALSTMVSSVKDGGACCDRLANGNPTKPIDSTTNPSNPTDRNTPANLSTTPPANPSANPTGESRKEVESTRVRGAVEALYPCSSCGRPSKYKCNSCVKNANQIFYCSKSCQAAHWRYHKGFCGRKDSEAGLALAKRGKAGLNNLGNTCYLNSAVQCLSHVQPLTQHILTNAFLTDLNSTNPLGTGGHLVQAYEQVLKDLWFGTGSSVSPTGLKSAVAKFAPRFNGYSQQDCQEVLSFLLDGLHEDINRVLKKPYLSLPDGECGRPDDVIAAEAWEMFKMRDKSVLVDNLYGQFKSTLECQQCGKVSRKFDEFNVMPVELLDGQPLRVVMDFAPLLKHTGSATHRKDGTPYASWILGGPGVEGRRQRRIGVLLPRDALVADLKEELAAMFSIRVNEMVIVVVPETGPPFYRALLDTDKMKPFTQGYEITAHECVPDQRYALVTNRLFEGGRHLKPMDEGGETKERLAQWAEGLRHLSNLRYGDREAPFLVSFPEDVSCLRLLELVWSYVGDFIHIPKEEHEVVGRHLAKSGFIKVSEAGNHFAPRSTTPMDPAQLYRQERADAENGVVLTDIGRYVPPTDRVSAAAVLNARRDKRQSLDFLRFEWSGLLLEKINEARINDPFGADNHVSLHSTSQRAKRVSLQDCLEKFSVPETLCKDNSWYCGNCNELRQAVKTIQVWSLPEVLILHFKRFSHAGPNRNRRKVELFVDFPVNGLDMSPYCRGETLEGGRPMSALYDLFAVSNHIGAMGHGHYTAFVRDWDGGGMSSEWHVCDDHECRRVHESRVCTSHAYVLFYRRRPLT